MKKYSFLFESMPVQWNMVTLLNLIDGEIEGMTYKVVYQDDEEKSVWALFVD
jgi:hypothetical protein